MSQGSGTGGSRGDPEERRRRPIGGGVRGDVPPGPPDSQAVKREKETVLKHRWLANPPRDAL